MTITTNNNILTFSAIGIAGVIDNYINFTPMNTVEPDCRICDYLYMTADVYQPRVSGTYKFKNDDPSTIIDKLGNSTLPEELYNSDKKLFMALNNGYGYVAYPRFELTPELNVDISKFTANVNFKLFSKRTVPLAPCPPTDLDLRYPYFETKEQTPFIVDSSAGYYEETVIWTIDQPMYLFDGIVSNVCRNSGAGDLKFTKITPPDVTITNNVIPYPNDVYLRSVDIVKDSTGKNGYSSVAMKNTDFLANTVYYSNNDTGNTIAFNVVINDIYYPNMNLKFNFIDSKCNEFCYMSDDPLITIHVGYLASVITANAPQALGFMNFLTKLIDSRGYTVVNATGKSSKLTIAPGNSNATYSSPVVPQPSKKMYRTSNYVTLSLTSNIKFITSFNDIKSLTPLARAGTTYNRTSVFGESLLLQVVLGCKYPNILLCSYDFSKLTITGIPDAFPSMGGVMKGEFLEGEFKSWLIILSPQQLASLGNSLSVGFTSGTGSPNVVNNLDIVAFDSASNGDYITSNVVASNASDYISTDIFTVSVKTTPNPYNWCWQTLLADSSTPTFTIGTAVSQLGTTPATSSSVIMGGLAVNKSSIANILLRNTSNSTYVVTSIVVTNATSPIALLTPVAKNSVLNDFDINANGVATPVITTTLTATLAVSSVELKPADAYNFVVGYTPKIKLVAMDISTYSTSPGAALSVANGLNAARKVKIQVMGYQKGTTPTSVALGDAVTIMGAVI